LSLDQVLDHTEVSNNFWPYDAWITFVTTDLYFQPKEVLSCFLSLSVVRKTHISVLEERYECVKSVIGKRDIVISIDYWSKFNWNYTEKVTCTGIGTRVC